MNVTHSQTFNTSCRYHAVNRSRSVLKMVSYILAILLLFIMPVLAQTQNQDRVCVRVDKVGKAPGFWSGIIASTQWVDATIIASSNKGYKVGDTISFGLYLIKGNEFADTHSPRLNPNIIYAGATLTIDTKASCRADGSKGWVYACIKKGCSRNFRP